MEPSTSGDLPLGLRERKKAKTRAAIQDQALRLFKEQGYAHTTVEQIAAAAEVSPSTFFRYFPTKEDVVIWDATDSQMLDAFREQPPDVSVMEALRRAMHSVYDSFTPEQAERERERQQLVLTVPELRMRTISTFAEAIAFLSGILAERIGRPSDDPEVRTFAGAIMGALLGHYLTFMGSDPRELVDHLDRVFDILDKSFRF